MSTSQIEHEPGSPPSAPVSAPPPPPAPAAGDRFWRLVWEALSGSRRDLTSMPLGRSILLLAVPMVFEMVGESVFAVADMFWVSKLGKDAIAAVVVTESLLTVVYTLSMGLAMGVGALVARRIGAKDHDGAARVAVQAVVMGLGVALAIGVAGAVAGPSLLSLMGAEPGVQAVGGAYVRVMLGGCAVVVLLFVNNAAFRGAGDASITMRTLWLANGINILLGPLLIFGVGPFPRMGVTGAAVATTIGRGTGVLFQLWMLRRGRGRLAVGRQHLAVDGQLIRAIVRISGTGMFQMAVGMLSWLGMVRIVNSFGSVAVAGYGIAFRVVMFALMPSWGLGNAAATLVGQNLGAGNPGRAEQAVWRAALYNLVFLGGVGMIFVWLGEPIVRLFTTEPGIVAEGSRCLRIVAAGFPFYAYGMVVVQAFNGAGDTRTPTLLNLLCFWVLELPLAYVVAVPLGAGPVGAYFAIALAFSVFAVAGVAVFRRGRWKSVKV